MSDANDLVWQGPSGQISNFDVQTFMNASVITYWSGDGAAANSANVGVGYGSVSILNTTYHEIYRVCPQLDITLPPGAENGTKCYADVHESYITSRNTMLVTVYNITQTDLSAVKDPSTGKSGPKDGWVYDPLAVEIDIITGAVVFLWSALAHVPINESPEPLSGTGTNSSIPYDWFHMNSIQSFGEDYLINSPVLSTTYYVNKSGDILWKIDGQTGGDFGSLPASARFSFQHYARLSPFSAFDPSHVVLRYFNDNNTSPSSTNPSKGLALLLTLPPSPANPPVILTDLADTNDLIASYAEGSYDVLPNGNHFVAYGIRPLMKEFGSENSTADHVRWSAQFGYNGNNSGAQSYRAYKKDWHATPATTRPSLVVGKAAPDDELVQCAVGEEMRGYVSWNGATDVEAWVVWIGERSSELEQIDVVPKRGFETEFVIPRKGKFIQVGAVEREGGEVVRMSDVVPM
ncbi:MAG: hypothetical protein Q9165_000272 [Trypethelium subeluteriae]